MKTFETYQCLDEPLTERDKLEQGSKFWNEGKWNNFVLPFFPNDCREMTFIDVGCNAGLFLKLAIQQGFKRVIGVEPDSEAYYRAILYRNKHKLNYEIVNKKIEEYIDEMPVSDIVLIANTHYYLTPEDWENCISKLLEKTCYCVIVTAQKKPNKKFAASDIETIKKDFNKWEEIKIIEGLPDKTPHARHLWGICFKNRLLERIDINLLDNGNNQQRDFLQEIDNGINVLRTNYYKRLKSYRKRTGSKQKIWSNEELVQYMNERIDLYNDVRIKGLKDPLTIKKTNFRITDGNHRHNIIKHLGGKTIIVKYE